MDHLELEIEPSEAKIYKTVWALAWPVVASYFLQTLVSLVDIKMVGVLGQENIAALGLALAAIAVVLIILIGASTGTMALIARYTGEKSQEKLQKTIWQSIYLGIASGLILTFVGVLFSEQILSWMGRDVNVVRIGKGYMEITAWGAVALTLNLIFTAIMIGHGDSKTPLIILFFINIINIIGNYLLIFGIGVFPRMDASGAALASVISRGIGDIIGFYYIFSRRFGVFNSRMVNFQYDGDIVRKIVNIGAFASMHMLVMRLSNLALNKILAHTVYGTKAISAYTIGLQAEALSFMPGLAFSTAATALVGQNLGAGKPNQAERSGMSALKSAALLMGILGLLLIVFAKYVVRFFTQDEIVVKLGVEYLIINSIAQPLIAVSMVTSGSFRGAGDAKTPMLVALFSLWMVRIPLAGILGLTTRLDALGVWIAMFCSLLLSSSILYRKFKKGEWKRIKL